MDIPNAKQALESSDISNKKYVMRQFNDIQETIQRKIKSATSLGSVVCFIPVIKELTSTWCYREIKRELKDKGYAISDCLCSDGSYTLTIKWE